MNEVETRALLARIIKLATKLRNNLDHFQSIALYQTETTVLVGYIKINPVLKIKK